jgi:hypothetical protein
MATTITAPVAPSPASGQQNVNLYPQGIVGTPLADITGASDTAAGQIKITVTSPSGAQATVWVTAAANAYTTASKFQFVPFEPGMHEIDVLDVTAGHTASTKVEVFDAG